MAKSATISDQLVIAGMSTGIGLMAHYYAKNNGKDQAAALMIGSLAGTALGILINSNHS